MDVKFTVLTSDKNQGSWLSRQFLCLQDGGGGSGGGGGGIERHHNAAWPRSLSPTLLHTDPALGLKCHKLV